MNLINNKSKQRGLTLVELMVALIISLLLMAGILQIFISNKKTYRVNEGISRLQENGRFALEFLSRDIRMADYKGCAASVPTKNVTKCPDGTTRPADGICTGQDDLVNNFSVGVEGFNNLSSSPPTYLSSDGINPVAGTDVVILRRNGDNGIRIVKNNEAANVFVEHTGKIDDGCGAGSHKYSGLCEGDILVVSDCSKARVFQAGNLSETAGGGGTVDRVNITHPSSGSPGNAPPSWGGSSAPDEERFGNDAELAIIQTYVYYIATGSNGYPSLFRKVGTTASQELVEGIQDMQVLYGEDRNSDSTKAATVYVDADNVVDWSDVVSIRVNLLVSSSQDFLAENNQSFTYNGATFTATDNRLYKPFTATISIRNRLR